MSGPRPAAAPNPSSPSRPQPPPPPPASAPARMAARVREEGEVSSGPSDDEALQSKLTALSNAAKFAHAAAQGASATFPGKGGSSLSFSNIAPQKSVAPSYKKTLRGSQGQFKLGTNRNLAWLKPVSSDNLVISFSDDDSETDSGMAKQYRSKSTKASSQVTYKTGITMQTRIMREEAPQQKTHAASVGSTKWSANPHALRSSGAGRGSGATFSRREPPSRQVTHLKSMQKDGNGAGVNSADEKLESLRHKIAARENELKVQKRPMSPGVMKDANFSSDQIRPPSEKIGFEASNSGGRVHPDGLLVHDDRPVKRLKPNHQCISNQASGDLVTLVPTGSSLGNENLISSGRRDHIENEITMNCNVTETEQAATTEVSDQTHPSATAKNLLSSQSHQMVIQDGGHATAEYHGKPAALPFTSDQSMAEDTSALVPVTSVRTGVNLERSSNHAEDHMVSAWDGQHVNPVDTSTVSNERPHLQPGMKNADLLNNVGQIGKGGQNTTLVSLFEMEELQERELDDAQEQRRKCEVEEREALRAYRKAQRNLIEANERCAVLRRKREICSAQVHGLIAENSSLVQCLNIQNSGHDLVMPSVLNSQFPVDCQMPEIQGGRSSSPYLDEFPQQPVDKHEARSRYCDEHGVNIADPKFVSTVHDNSTPSDYREDDLMFRSKRARSECTSNLENHMEETIQVYSENRQPSGDSTHDYELLEASLRSRLVKRLGMKSCLNNSCEVPEELAVGKAAEIEQDKQSAHVELQLQEADDIVMPNPEGSYFYPSHSYSYFLLLPYALLLMMSYTCALLLLARSIEADPSTVILWVFYLHIYYQKDEGLGKDDMFSHAVQHNVNSYELWLMYINSRLRFDDRLDAYNDALSMLCQMTADTDNELKDRSAFILDIFLQMIYFLCMSGNVEKAIYRIYGILPTASPDCPGDRLLADAISCLTVSDRCIFWISCLYVSIYRKLPEEICDQLEFPKDLPRVLVWHPVELRVDNRRKVAELLKCAVDKMAVDINETVKNGDPSYLKLAQFLAVSHISCLAAIEGFQSSVDMLVKYMKEYPRLWIEGANLLEKLQASEIVKRFHQQATSVYPFSFKLWHAYLTACKASGSNTESIAEAARQRGIELNVMPP
uniref:Uncharacterized protein n=1 Tax=Avena sativa TaxID=4498 RepID=A0ACD5XMI4_AVESA